MLAGMTTFTPTFAVVELVTDDLAASLAFYRRLGLDIPPAADSAPHVEVEVGAGIRIAWDPAELVRSFDPEWTRPAGGQISLAFRCGDRHTVDATYQDLTEAGYHGKLAPWDAPWGQRYAVVHDPDGNGVDLFAPLPD